METKLDLKVTMKGTVDLPFFPVEKAVGSLDKELAASGLTRKEQVEMEKYIEEDAEVHDSSSDDDGDDDKVGDPVHLASLKIDQDGSVEPDCKLASRYSDVPGTFSEAHETSYNSENRLGSPPSGGNGEVMKLLESGDNALESLGAFTDEDAEEEEEEEEEEDTELMKQLNKQRKKAKLPTGGEGKCHTGTPTKDKGKGTMNSMIQRHACKW